MNAEGFFNSIKTPISPDGCRHITVSASRTYDVTVGHGILDTVGDRIRDLVPRASRTVLVSDDTVYALYGERVTASLSAAGLRVSTFVFPHGEAQKSPETLLSLWRFMAKETVTRTDAIIALGGGVTGDLAGFAAATYLRGIAVLQIPTTLLAMVDSSVGGKTAVDLPEGKNLVGTFYQPHAVLCDIDTLKTLPREIFASGMAEVIKYGMIRNEPLFSYLEATETPDVPAVIAAAVEDKRAVVECDERDTGIREILNFGHTLGHAVEHLSHFSIAHGEAVAIGMMLVTRAAVRRGWVDATVEGRLSALLTRYALPTETRETAERILSVAAGDKKRKGDRITLVLPEKVGHVRREAFTLDALLSYIKEGLLP